MSVLLYIDYKRGMCIHFRNNETAHFLAMSSFNFISTTCFEPPAGDMLFQLTMM